VLKKFNYRAWDSKTNKTVSGVIEAENIESLEGILVGLNLSPISMKEIKLRELSSLFQKKVNPKDLISLFVIMEQFEKSKIPLLDSLQDMSNFFETPRLRNVMRSIYESVKGGEMFSTAISKHPSVFNDITVNLVALGENTGNLAISFRSIHEGLSWDNTVKRKTKAALRGPIMSLVFTMGAIMILLTVSVPKILSFLKDQEIEVPFYTKMLMATSDFLSGNSVSIAGGALALFIIIKILLMSNRFRIIFDQFKLKMPIFGKLISKIGVTNFAKFFGITVTAGVPILSCLEIAGSTVNNAYMRDEIKMIAKRVAEGMTISKSMEQSGAFPFVVVRMLKMGETSGNMVASANNIQNFYEGEISSTIETVTSATQPIIFIVAGIMLCWVIAAVFGPIYSNFVLNASASM
jgi:type IV pilus assembly protein PilC